MNLFLSTKRTNLLVCLVFSFDKTSRQFVAIRERPINKYVSKMHTITNLVYRDKLHVNITKL